MQHLFDATRPVCEKAMIVLVTSCTYSQVQVLTHLHILYSAFMQTKLVFTQFCAHTRTRDSAVISLRKARAKKLKIYSHIDTCQLNNSKTSLPFSALIFLLSYCLRPVNR